MSFFRGSPTLYLSPMCLMVSFWMNTASIPSEDCPFEEHWLKFTPSIAQKSWRRSSSGLSYRLVIWLKVAMLVLFDCPTLFVCTSEELALSLPTQAECWLRMWYQWVPLWTPWEPLLWMHLLQSVFRSGCPWLLEILCSGGENGLCRSHSTFQFELLASETPPLLLRTQGSCPRSFLLVAASLVLLRNSCLLLSHSALIVTLLSVVVVVLRVHRLRVKIIFVPVAPVWSAAVRSIFSVHVSIPLVVVCSRLLPLLFIIKVTSIVWLVSVCLVSEGIVLWALIPVPTWLCILLLMPCISPKECWVMAAIASFHEAPCLWLAETLFVSS